MNLIESLGLNPGVIADVVLAAIIIWELLSGMRKGAVRMIGGLLELGGGIYAGNLLRKAHSADAARWLVPAVRDVLDAAMNKLGLTDILENLDNILDTSRLPDFLKQDVLEQVKVRVGSGTETALSGAAGVIAQRLAGLLLFLLGMIVVTIVFRIIFQAVIDPVISNVPLLDESNRFLGAVMGAAFGVPEGEVREWIAGYAARREAVERLLAASRLSSEAKARYLAKFRDRLRAIAQ